MGKTVVSDDGRFEWDEQKDRDNVPNHGFHLSAITEIFDDPDFISVYDEKNSSFEEDRYRGIGSVMLGGRRLTILVSYTERPPRTRIISARALKPHETGGYNDTYKKTHG